MNKNEQIAKEYCNKEFCSKCGLTCTEDSQCHEWKDGYTNFLAGLRAGRQGEQLTKAKKLLKRFLAFLEYEGITNWISNTYNETKQFLEETE